MNLKVGIISVFLVLAGISVLPISCSGDNADEEAGKAGQLWTCSMHPEVIMDKPGQCPKCGMNLVPVKRSGTDTAMGSMTQTQKTEGERKILYWQAPMNPTEIYDKPGKSAMGMDLVPVYADQVSSGGMVEIDPATVQNMGVRTAVVKKTDFARSIRTVGYVDYNEENIFIVSSKISGWIEKLYVDYTGRQVKKGQPLLKIYSPELVTTQQEYLLALKTNKMVSGSKFSDITEGAETLLKATHQRLLYWDIPESEISRLQETGEVRKSLTLESPANGVVVHKNAYEGMHIGQGMSLYQITDLSTVWIDASIYDNELPWIRLGQKATVELSYLPGKELEGQVVYIYPYLDQKARDVKVRLEFNNPHQFLKPGMYANVRIKTTPIKDALVVPSEAVIRSGQRNLIFVTHGNGRFEPREVRIGEEGDNGKIRIISGLLENEEVVISAQFLLDSESRLQEAIQKMLEEKKTGGNDKMNMDKNNTGNDHSMDMDSQINLNHMTDDGAKLVSTEEMDRNAIHPEKADSEMYRSEMQMSGKDQNQDHIMKIEYQNQRVR
jgi:RND family efflux transporter MFP subunit